MLKGYDMTLHYYLGKDNVVANALTRSSMESLSHIEEKNRGLVKYIHRLANKGVHQVDSKYGGMIVQEVSRLSLVVQVKKKLVLDPILMQIKEEVWP